MFVKWSCGCKGLLIDGHCWVISACDSDPYTSHEPFGFFQREMGDPRAIVVGRKEYDTLTDDQKREMIPKSHTPLPYDEIAEMLVQMNQLIKDGYAFREIQWLLKRTWNKPKQGE